MRIPDLNVTQSVTQRLKDLNLQRFKLDQQITSGQKITYAEDDGAKMSRTIQLCLLYTSPSPRDLSTSRMPSSA